MSALIGKTVKHRGHNVTGKVLDVVYDQDSQDFRLLILSGDTGAIVAWWHGSCSIEAPRRRVKRVAEAA